MAKKTKTEPKRTPKVYCSECRHFARDTEGISRRIDTGEYFMGICSKGITDGGRKVFADKPRECIKSTNNGRMDKNT